MRRRVRYGASPRGAQALMVGARAMALLQGRFNVSTNDVRRVLLPVLRHRIIRNFEAEAANVTTGDILAELVGTVGELPSR